MDIKKVKPIINLYLKELKRTIRPDKVIVFGSYAKGKATPESDLDMVVISKDFTNITHDKRFSLLSQARRHPKTRKIAMDIFGYTPKEYDSASLLTTLGEVKETGVTVFSS